MTRYLVVDVKRGRGLAAKDKNGLSDPYVRLHLNRKRAKSKIKKKTLNPEWDETFFLGPVQDGDVLVVDCWDYDMGFSDDFMGRIEVMFTEGMLARGGVPDSWIALEGRGRKEEVSGELLMSWGVSDEPQKKLDQVHRHHGGLGMRRGTSVLLSNMKHLGGSLSPRSSSTAAPAPAPAAAAPAAAPSLAVPAEPQGDAPTAVPGRPVFGVPLPALMERQRASHPDLAIPLYLHRALAALEASGALREKVGIFRVSGCKRDIKDLLAKGEDVDFADASPHAITHIVKLFLRELPEPLLTFGLYDRLVQPACEAKKLAPVDEVLAQVKAIPQTQFAVLCRILEVFHEIMCHRDLTKMDAQNLSIVMAPNLVWERRSGADGQETIQSLNAYRTALSWVTSLGELLINHAALLTGADAAEADAASGYAVEFESLSVADVFARYDEDDNGELDEQEFAIFYKDFLQATGAPPPTNPEIHAAICAIDEDGNGTISPDEFSLWWDETH